MVTAAILAYTIWLIRYAGMRIPQETADASTQAHGGMIDKTRRLLGAFGVPERGTQVAPANVMTVPYGRCYHIEGCWHTRVPRSSPSVFLLKDGIINFKRCEHCMPSAGGPLPRSVARASGQLFGQRPRVYINFTPYLRRP